MKKALFSLIIAVVGFSVHINAQSNVSFDKATSCLHAGIGFGGRFYSGSVTLPPLSVSYEKAVTDKISAGGIVGYSGSQYTYKFGGSAYKWKYSYLLIGARGNYHFATAEKFDPYGGLTLGYNIVGVKSPGQIQGYSAKGSALLFGGQVGTNYYFSANMGAFAELGYGIGVLTIGATFKL